MKKSFDEILSECIRRVEASGGDIEGALGRYPEHAEELRPYLEVWASFSAVEKAQPTAGGTARGRQQLLTAIAKAEQEGRHTGAIAGYLATKGGLSMRYLGMLVVGAALALGVTFLTGNLDFGGGASTAEADPFTECLPILDVNGDGQTNLDDILDMKAALAGEPVSFDPDFDGNGVVDIFDVVFKLNQFAQCLEAEGIAIGPP